MISLAETHNVDVEKFDNGVFYDKIFNEFSGVKEKLDGQI